MYDDTMARAADVGAFKREFNVGALPCYLGAEVKQGREDFITLGQHRLLERAGMAGCKSMLTTMEERVTEDPWQDHRTAEMAETSTRLTAFSGGALFKSGGGEQELTEFGGANRLAVAGAEDGGDVDPRGGAHHGSHRSMPSYSGVSGAEAEDWHG